MSPTKPSGTVPTSGETETKSTSLFPNPWSEAPKSPSEGKGQLFGGPFGSSRRPNNRTPKPTPTKNGKGGNMFLEGPTSPLPSSSNQATGTSAPSTPPNRTKAFEFGSSFKGSSPTTPPTPTPTRSINLAVREPQEQGTPSRASNLNLESLNASSKSPSFTFTLAPPDSSKASSKTSSATPASGIFGRPSDLGSAYPFKPQRPSMSSGPGFSGFSAFASSAKSTTANASATNGLSSSSNSLFGLGPSPFKSLNSTSSSSPQNPLNPFLADRAPEGLSPARSPKPGPPASSVTATGPGASGFSAFSSSATSGSSQFGLSPFKSTSSTQNQFSTPRPLTEKIPQGSLVPPTSTSSPQVRFPNPSGFSAFSSSSSLEPKSNSKPAALGPSPFNSFLSSGTSSSPNQFSVHPNTSTGNGFQGSASTTSNSMWTARRGSDDGNSKAQAGGGLTGAGGFSTPFKSTSNPSSNTLNSHNPLITSGGLSGIPYQNTDQKSFPASTSTPAHPWLRPVASSSFTPANQLTASPGSAMKATPIQGKENNDGGGFVGWRSPSSTRRPQPFFFGPVGRMLQPPSCPFEPLNSNSFFSNLKVHSADKSPPGLDSQSSPVKPEETGPPFVPFTEKSPGEPYVGVFQSITVHEDYRSASFEELRFVSIRASATRSTASASLIAGPASTTSFSKNVDKKSGFNDGALEKAGFMKILLGTTQYQIVLKSISTSPWPSRSLFGPFETNNGENKRLLAAVDTANLTGPPLPLCLEGAAIDILGDTLYYFGGGFDRLIHAVDLKSGKRWSIEAHSVSGMPLMSRTLATLTATGNELYIVGGVAIQDGVGPTHHCDFIDVVQLPTFRDLWQTGNKNTSNETFKATWRPMLPKGGRLIPRKGHSATLNICSGEIFLVGGTNEADRPMGISVFRFQDSRPVNRTDWRSYTSANEHDVLPAQDQGPVWVHPYHSLPVSLAGTISDQQEMFLNAQCAHLPGLLLQEDFKGLYVFGTGARGASRLNLWDFESPYSEMEDRFCFMGMKKGPVPKNDNIQRTSAYSFRPRWGFTEAGEQGVIILVCWYYDAKVFPATTTAQTISHADDNGAHTKSTNADLGASNPIVVPFEVWKLNTQSREMKAIDLPTAFFEGWLINEVAVIDRQLVGVGRKKDEKELTILRRVGIQPTPRLFGNP